MIFRRRNYDESALQNKIISAVQDVLPGNDFDFLEYHDPREGNLLKMNFGKKIKASDVENVVLKLEDKKLYNTRGGISFSEGDNGLFINLSGFTDSPIYTPNPLASAQLLGSEMERYIAIDKYNDHEAGHPGYHEMMKVVLDNTMGAIKKGKQGKVLEIGAGTGNFTRLIGERRAKVDAIEIDPGSAEYIQHKIKAGEIKKTSLIVEDALPWTKKKTAASYDAVVTTFSDHHFSPAKKPEFLKEISRLIKKDGVYVAGDEFLPPHDEKDPAQRVSAQIKYHGMVIEEAFKEGKVELPKLELDALISGLRTTVTFIQQTAPEHKDNEFLVRKGAGNLYNKEGIKLLGELAGRLEQATPTANPEHLDEATITDQRKGFIEIVRNLQKEMEESRRPGLEESLFKGKVGGDYKMTIKQYTQQLKKAGMQAVGFFEGPKAVGSSNDKLDGGTGNQSIILKPEEDHAGGVWVIKATRDRTSEPSKTRS